MAIYMAQERQSAGGNAEKGKAESLGHKPVHHMPCYVKTGST